MALFDNYRGAKWVLQWRLCNSVFGGTSIEGSISKVFSFIFLRWVLLCGAILASSTFDSFLWISFLGWLWSLQCLCRWILPNLFSVELLRIKLGFRICGFLDPYAADQVWFCSFSGRIVQALDIICNLNFFGQNLQFDLIDFKNSVYTGELMEGSDCSVASG